jgi:hypothetical protein
MKDVVPYCDKRTAQLAVNEQHFILVSQGWANVSYHLPAVPLATNLAAAKCLNLTQKIGRVSGSGE